MSISSKDRQILRELAARQAELAESPRNKQLYQDWVDYGAGRGGSRPMIRIEIETFEHQLLPQRQRCAGEEARRMERRMLRPIVNFTEFEDDTLVPAYYAVRKHTRFVPFGLSVKRRESGGLGHHVIPYLRTLEEDGHCLAPLSSGWTKKGPGRKRRRPRMSSGISCRCGRLPTAWAAA